VTVSGIAELRSVRGIHPLNLDAVSPPRVARWRPVINWLLVIPSELWLVVLMLGAQVVAFVGWFAILFTGRFPDSWGDYLMGVLRYQWRVTAFLYTWSGRVPEFSTPAGYVDPGRQPAILYCARPLVRNRLTVFFRAAMVIPHYIILSFVSIAGVAVLLLAWFAVLFIGRWPERMRRFCIGWLRWATRVQAYLLLVTDVYPPFRFDA
jgi:hypothetical protein